MRHAGRRGQATLEYVVLLIAVAICALALTVQVGQTVKRKWMGDDGSGGAFAQLEGAAAGAGAPNDGAGGGCNFYYNPSTGRWHDPETNLFVSFDDAGAAGC